MATYKLVITDEPTDELPPRLRDFPRVIRCRRLGRFGRWWTTLTGLLRRGKYTCPRQAIDVAVLVPQPGGRQLVRDFAGVTPGPNDAVRITFCRPGRPPSTGHDRADV